jgi:hypothetical protein
MEVASLCLCGASIAVAETLASCRAQGRGFFAVAGRSTRSCWQHQAKVRQSEYL